MFIFSISFIILGFSHLKLKELMGLFFHKQYCLSIVQQLPVFLLVIVNSIPAFYISFQKNYPQMFYPFRCFIRQKLI